MSLGQRQRAAPVFQPWPPRKRLTPAPSSTRCVFGWSQRACRGPVMSARRHPSRELHHHRWKDNKLACWCSCPAECVWTHTGINQQSFFFFFSVANPKHVCETLGCGDQIALTRQTHTAGAEAARSTFSGGCFYLRLCTTFGAAPWLELELEIQYSNSKRFNILLASSKPVQSYFYSFSGCRVFLGLHESIQYWKKKETHRQMPRGAFILLKLECSACGRNLKELKCQVSRGFM